MTLRLGVCMNYPSLNYRKQEEGPTWASSILHPAEANFDPNPPTRPKEFSSRSRLVKSMLFQKLFFRRKLQIQVVPPCIFRFCDSLKISHLAGSYRAFEMDHIPSHRRIFIPQLTLKIILISHPALYLCLILRPSKPMWGSRARASD